MYEKENKALNEKFENWDTLPLNLNLDQVAKIMSISNSTIKRWLYEGKIKGTKLGRKWLFNKEYIKSLTQT